MTAVSEAIARLVLGQGQPGDKELVADHGHAVLPVSSTQPPRQTSKQLDGYENDPRYDPEYEELAKRGRWDEANARLAVVTRELAERARKLGPERSGLMPNPGLPQPATVKLDDDMRAQPYARPPTQTTVVHKEWSELHEGDEQLMAELEGRKGLRGARPMPATAPVAPPARRPPSLADLGNASRRTR